MKFVNLASALLAVVLVGCAMPDSGSRSNSSMSRSPAYAQSDPAVVHSMDFGDPNNEPFNGVYSSTW
jgi:hypothetical protein